MWHFKAHSVCVSPHCGYLIRLDAIFLANMTVGAVCEKAKKTRMQALLDPLISLMWKSSVVVCSPLCNDISEACVRHMVGTFCD